MQNKKYKVIVSAGGSGGHIIPALSVCKTLISKNVEVYYIGNENSMEYDIISRNHIPFYSINVQKLYREFTIKHLLFPFKLISSILKCIKHIQQIKPDAFIGFGGFVSGPAAFTAWLMKYPVFLQEQNCKPGITNQLTGKFAKKVFLAYDDSRKYFNEDKTFVTGNPVILSVNKNMSSNLKAFSFRANSKKLLILGGSQGSQFVNNLIFENLDWFFENKIDLIWQTGKNHLKCFKEKVKGREGVFVFDFTDEINNYYQMADFVLSRGGALSLSEIEIYKKPVFIIPLASAAVNEQLYNARFMEKRNMGVVFEQSEKNIFVEKFISFMEKADSMYLESKESIHLTAAEKIAELIIKNIEKKN